jgi:hypothetical protein
LRTKITTAVVRNTLPPAAGYVLLWDVFLTGFGLRVTAAGVRSFVVETRICCRTRRVTLGQWPATPIALAQRRARTHLSPVSADQDPIKRRSSRRMLAVTVEQAFQAYVRNKRRFKDGLPLSARTQRDALGVLNRHIEDWKRRSLSSITRPMVQRRYRELCARSVSQANLTMRYLSAVLGFTIQKVRDAGSMVRMSASSRTAAVGAMRSASGLLGLSGALRAMSQGSGLPAGGPGPLPRAPGVLQMHGAPEALALPDRGPCPC